MAEYHYDESGSMAAYFLLTFLLVVLIPLTFSSSSVFSKLILQICIRFQLIPDRS